MKATQIPDLAVEMFWRGNTLEAYQAYLSDATRRQGAIHEDDFMKFTEFCDATAPLASRKSNQEEE